MKATLNKEQFQDFFKGDKIAQEAIKISSQDLNQIDELLHTTMHTPEYREQVVNDLFRSAHFTFLGKSQSAFNTQLLANNFNAIDDAKKNIDLFLDCFKGNLKKPFTDNKIQNIDQSIEFLIAGFHQASFILLGKSAIKNFFLHHQYVIDPDHEKDKIKIFKGKDNNLYVSHEYKISKSKDLRRDLDNCDIETPFEIKTIFCLNPEKFDMSFSIDTKDLHKRTELEFNIPEKKIIQNILFSFIRAIKNLFRRESKHQLALPEHQITPEAHITRIKKNDSKSCH
jgi:hypothetical protein